MENADTSKRTQNLIDAIFKTADEILPEKAQLTQKLTEDFGLALYYVKFSSSLSSTDSKTGMTRLYLISNRVSHI